MRVCGSRVPRSCPSSDVSGISVENEGSGALPSRLRYRPNHSSRSSISGSTEISPSWPPATHLIVAGVMAGSARKFASAWSRGNSVSSSPWMISVGARIAGTIFSRPDSSSNALSLASALAGLGRLEIALAQGWVESTAELSATLRLLISRIRPCSGVREQQGRPTLLEHSLSAGGGDVSGRDGCADHLILREKRLSQTVPREGGHDRIDSRIESGGKERERPAVRRPGEADHRIVAVLGDLGTAGGEIYQLAGIGSFVGGIVEVNQAAGVPEASGGVDDHRVAGQRERPGGRLAVTFGTTEPVRQHDGRAWSRWISGENRRVERNRLAIRLRRTQHHKRLFDHVVLGVRRDRERAQQYDEKQHRCWSTATHAPILLARAILFGLAARASRALDPPSSSSLAEEERLRSLLLTTAGARFPTLAAADRSLSDPALAAQPAQFVPTR